MLLINKIYVCMLISDVTNTDVVVQSHFHTYWCGHVQSHFCTFRNHIVFVTGSTITESWTNDCMDFLLQLPARKGSSNNKLVRFYWIYWSQCFYWNKVRLKISTCYRLYRHSYTCSYVLQTSLYSHVVTDYRHIYACSS